MRIADGTTELSAADLLTHVERCDQRSTLVQVSYAAFFPELPFLSAATRSALMASS